MTKKKFLWGMLVFVFGLVLAGCPTDGDGGGGGGNNGAPATSGKLTITGLGSYNGKFAYATGSIGGASAVVCAKVTSEAAIEAVLISGGQVELPVYKYADYKYESYSGNDTVSTLSITIYSSKVIGAQATAIGSSSVTFASGVGTVSNPTLTAVP
ncbi:MAG: hypothetical protein LBD86_07790 [Spirochaetaceae bacterium]|jgi:hypothetical protein|nr:hypothetical protein [Spirochaetaceae bacterium]